MRLKKINVRFILAPGAANVSKKCICHRNLPFFVKWKKGQRNENKRKESVPDERQCLSLAITNFFDAKYIQDNSLQVNMI